MDYFCIEESVRKLKNVIIITTYKAKVKTKTSAYSFYIRFALIPSSPNINFVQEIAQYRTRTHSCNRSTGHNLLVIGLNCKYLNRFLL